MSTTANEIRSKLVSRLGAAEVAVEDESHLHAGHPGAAGGGGHYRIRVVADAFEGKSLLERHRMVYEALGDLMDDAIHALSMKTLSPSEA